jgi:hypothetical protein
MTGPTGGPAVPSFSLPPGGHELADRDARALELLFAKAQELGFIGPGSVSDQITRSTAFATVAGSPPEGPVVDLGSGGGLPALVLALVWPGTAWPSQHSASVAVCASSANVPKQSAEAPIATKRSSLPRELSRRRL